MSKIPPITGSAFITSLREFTRNPKLRKQALKQKKPVIVQNKKEQDFFVLLPSAAYEDLYELYRDLRDSDDFKAAMEEKTEWQDWEEIKSDIL